MIYPMKLLPVKILTLGTLIFTISCGTIDYAKKYPNMVANVDPISVGTVDAQFGRFMSSKLKKHDVEVVFYPRLNAVALEFRYELIQHRQFWDLEARKQFTQALEQYKTDYADRKLIDRHRRTRSVYGKTQIRLEWEAFKYTKTRIAYPIVDIGYRFREKMPFFSTVMRTASEAPTEMDNNPRGESAQISMFFTRAQADEVVKLFDQDYLMGLLGPRNNPQSGGQNEQSDLDAYREYDG